MNIVRLILKQVANSESVGADSVEFSNRYSFFALLPSDF